MIIKPKVRNNICINSHPAGCAKVVRNQIAYTIEHLAGGRPPEPAAGKDAGSGPGLVLVLGCSTGYGLASRIAAAFGYGAATVGVSFEKPASLTKPGTPGWYNNLTVDAEAAKAGLASMTLDGDAYSDEMKIRAAAALRETAAASGIPPKVDLIVYSLASPVRTDPKTGITYRSTIRPIGKSYSGTTLDMMTGAFSTATAEPANEEEIAATIKVMGGEDWELWIEALDREGLLSAATRTVAYTYIGPELSWPIYREGTIGKAKLDLERAAKAIGKKLGAKTESAGQNAEQGAGKNGGAWISVNKALVTRASAVIPVIPFYVSSLFKIMKGKGIHEGCIEQIVRLYKERLYSAEAGPAEVPVDGEGRIRIDDWEMREDVQKATGELMNRVTPENVFELTDIAGFKHDFLEAHGFEVEGIDYEEDVDPSRIE
jgi:enoyl-[acyl-carrier protein] reductase/trans-2-enoyl-CoA reductase (NAD+)